jgi:hypothetical protein
MSGRRLLVVHPGASWSTHDVFMGLTAGLRALGHTVYVYGLDGRIERAVSWLRHCYDQERMAGREVVEPNSGDYLMHAAGSIFERAAIYRAHAILFISGMYIPTPILAGLQHFNIPTGLILTESPYDDEHELRWASFAHMVWTNERTSVAGLRRINPHAHYLPAAYDPFRHQPDPQLEDENYPAHDVIFVGTGFPERIDLLSAVDWTGIDLGLYGNWDAVIEAGASHPLYAHVKAGVVENYQAAALYRRAKIGLNLYRTSKGFNAAAGHIAHAESLNPRAYELAAVGCFQIATWRDEAADVFTLRPPHQPMRVLGSIYPAQPDYDPAEHLSDQIRGHLESGMRREYARAATELIRPHTFEARAWRLMTQFETVLTDAWGPMADESGDAGAAPDADPAAERDAGSLGAVAEAATGAQVA